MWTPTICWACVSKYIKRHFLQLWREPFCITFTKVQNIAQWLMPSQLLCHADLFLNFLSQIFLNFFFFCTFILPCFFSQPSSKWLSSVHEADPYTHTQCPEGVLRALGSTGRRPLPALSVDSWNPVGRSNTHNGNNVTCMKDISEAYHLARKYLNPVKLKEGKALGAQEHSREWRLQTLDVGV